MTKKIEKLFTSTYVSTYACIWIIVLKQDEEDLEEKFGPMETLEDASEILRAYVSNREGMALFADYMEEFPDSKEDLREIFGVDEAA